MVKIANSLVEQVAPRAQVILQAAERFRIGSFTLKDMASRSYEMLLMTGKAQKKPEALVAKPYAKVLMDLAELEQGLTAAGVDITDLQPPPTTRATRTKRAAAARVEDDSEDEETDES